MSSSRSGDQVPATPSPGPGDAGHGGGRPGDGPGKGSAGVRRAGFALLLTLSMAQFMVVLDFTIVNVALPSIQHGLHVATTTLQWLISGYAVAFGGFLLLGGRLADAYGRVRLYRIGLVVFVLASIAGGLAVEPGLLIASFRLLPPDPPGSKGKLDVPGAITVTAGDALLVYAVARAGDTLRVTQPALLFGAAVVLLGAFVVRERRAGAPILDLALLKDRGILGANLALIAIGAYSAGQVLLVTLYLQEGRGLSPLLTGLCFVPQAAGAFALAGPASNIVPALGPRRALAAGLGLALLALAGNAVAVLTGSLPALLAGSFVLGIANRLSQVSSTLAGTQGPVAARSEGTASALLTATRQCGSALGVAILAATLVAVHGGTSHRTGVAVFVAAGFALAGLLATRVVPAGPPHPQAPQPQHLFRHHAGGIS